MFDFMNENKIANKKMNAIIAEFKRQYPLSPHNRAQALWEQYYGKYNGYY